jgi:tetratricopeptide (TPR) repeat protein
MHPAPAGLAARLQQANAFHQRGQLAHASVLYEEILKAQPNNFDALHLLGVIAAQRRDPKKAVDLIARAIKVDPKQAAPYCNRGIALHALKQLDAALASFDQAIALKPDYAMAFCNRGNVLKELQRFTAALVSYDRAIAIKPNFPEAYSNRGNVESELGQWDAALASYDKAIALKADFAEAHFNRGNALKALQRFDLALESYDTSIAIKADHAEAHCNRGNLLKELNQPDAALESYRRAIAIKSDYAEAHFNRGNLLREMRQFEPALASYDAAIAIHPRFANAHLNRGLVLKDLHRWNESLASYDRAIAIQPDFAEAYVNRATAWLLRGELARGWRDYEWRWKNPSGPNIREKRQFPQPLWGGAEPIAGSTILLHSEQGLGDTLQFCRYAKLVSDRGARVILEVQRPLMSLLQSLDGVSQLIPRGADLPAFDRHCPLLSLPLAFNTTVDTIPAPTPYLRSDPAKIAAWDARLGDKIKPRIGLTWSGNPNQVNDLNRSIPLAALVACLPTGFQYVCLQTEVRESDRPALLASCNILFFGDELDFANTAALCECLDLVLSVDTSVAHLSAALGRTTWVLLHFNADWRWLRGRDDSPWYPTATLYRQGELGDWSGVFARVGDDLVRTFSQGIS